MKLFHTSDLHGDLYCITLIPKDADVILFTGDIFPNRSRGNVAVEVIFQEEWFKTKLPLLFRELRSRPVITVGGNHDFVSLGGLLKKYGYSGDVHMIAPDKVIELGGYRWAGHGAIPWIEGEWNDELRTPEMLEIVNQVLDHDADMLVTHCPPAGILAGPWGCGVLANALAYRGLNKYKHHFFGHVHNYGGHSITDGSTTYWNSATTCQTISLV